MARKSRHGQRLLARLTVLASGLLIVSGSVTWLPQDVGAAPGASQQPIGTSPVPPDVAGEVDPIPYVFPPNGGGSGGAALDPSVQPRPEFSAGARPSSRAALDEAWTADQRVWANPDGSFTLERGQNLNFVDAEGSWTPIDLSLVEGKAGEFHPAAAPTATVGDSFGSGRWVNDLGAGWNALQQMSPGEQAEFWTTVVGGGATAGASVNGLLAARNARKAAAVADAVSPPRGYGSLSQAPQYGIWPYKTLAKDLTGTGFEAHHLLPKRFAAALGQAEREMASVAVTQAEHLIFSRQWAASIPNGVGTARATVAQIRAAAREIYAGYPDIIRILGL